jgi:hypothetical protein
MKAIIHLKFIIVFCTSVKNTRITLVVTRIFGSCARTEADSMHKNLSVELMSLSKTSVLKKPRENADLRPSIGPHV